MEEVDQGQRGPSPGYVLSRAAEQVGDDTPPPERIVLQRASDEVWVCRIEVLNTDQPYGMTFRLNKDS